MRMLPIRGLAWTAGVVLLAAVAWSFMPRPASVETAPVTRGPMTVTIDEEAKTRVRDRYTLSAPVGGYLTRIALRPGAVLHAGDTVALILPSQPAPIDARARAELQARVAAATDAVRRARLQHDAALLASTQAGRELERHRQLARDSVVSAQELESARLRHEMAQADATSAAAAADVAVHDLEAARAALLAGDRPAGRATVVRAPHDGLLLRVFEESERAVTPGTPLVELGAPEALEIVAEMLTTDAVRIAPHAAVLVDRWGGAAPLNGRVRLVEPSSFTKVSALGVEEQRVNVIIDFTDPPDCWKLLGDRFAVEVRVVVWQADAAIKVPVGALFRRGDAWAVYTAAGGRAVERTVRVVARNDREAAVDEGLSQGDLVVIHPSDKISDRTRISVR